MLDVGEVGNEQKEEEEKKKRGLKQTREEASLGTKFPFPSSLVPHHFSTFSE